MTCIYEFHLAAAQSLSLSVEQAYGFAFIKNLSHSCLSMLSFNLCSFRNAKLSPIVKNVSWSNGAIMLEKGMVEPTMDFLTPSK